MRYLLIGLAVLIGLAASAALVVRSFQTIPEEVAAERTPAPEVKPEAPAAAQPPVRHAREEPVQLPVAAVPPPMIAAIPPDRSMPQRPQAGADLGPLRLSEEQRGRLRDVLLTHNVMQTEASLPAIRIGATVPEDIQLSPLPIEIADAVPAYVRYSYVIADNRIAIVRNEKREIEAVIPF